MTHLNDDRVYIEFDSKKVDYTYLVKKIFPEYILHFCPYSSEIYCESLIFKDFEKSRNKNKRKSIDRVYPVCFYDEKFCKDVFNKSPKKIVSLLNGEVFNVELFGNGIKIIAGLTPFSISESEEFDKKVRSILSYYI